MKRGLMPQHIATPNLKPLRTPSNRIHTLTLKAMPFLTFSFSPMRLMPQQSARNDPVISNHTAHTEQQHTYTHPKGDSLPDIQLLANEADAAVKGGRKGDRQRQAQRPIAKGGG